MAAVSFVERSNEANYILVMNDEDENSSFVGMLGGVQALKISNWTRRLILHEIGHALGLSHEHQRSDRDDFVDVIWENIRSEKKGAFEIRDTVNFGTYDFQSIMHYRRDAFSANGEDTVVPKPQYSEHLNAMERLDLGNNQIEILEPLSGLTGLNWLVIGENKITDISPLERLTSLNVLNLYYNLLDMREGSPAWQVYLKLDGISKRFRISPQHGVLEPLDIFRGFSIPNAAGWKSSSWYSNYNDDFWPWIFHDEHGWLYISESSRQDAIFLWDLGLGNWIYFNSGIYRWMFLFSDDQEEWIWTFEDNTPDHRRFYRHSDESFFSLSTE